jgi:protein-disulfide isomerase
MRLRRLLLVLVPTLACAPASCGAASDNVQLITAKGQQEMLANPGTDPVGAANPDVVIVEYFDYNCPYCKRLVPALQAVLKQDPKVAIVYKEWPILGPVSEYAAASALAAGWQGKYLAAHDALMSASGLTANVAVDAALQKAGVNLDTLKADRTRHAQEITALLARNDSEAHALSLSGTPGVVVGRLLTPGSPELDDLQKLIAYSRKSKPNQ